MLTLALFTLVKCRFIVNQTKQDIKKQDSFFFRSFDNENNCLLQAAVVVK